MDDDVISISSSSDGEGPTTRLDIFEPVVQRVVDALGGFNQASPPVYVPGDSALLCLKDLKTLWRKDDTDDDRTVARLFKRVNLLSNDLVPILRVTAPDDKRAIAAADLVCAMTWPIDLAEELKELDDEWDKNADFTELSHAHRIYKAALLQPNVLDALFAILLPPLALSPRERTPRSQQVVSVILHILRNLAFIRDLPPSAQGTSDQAQFSTLQSLLVQRMQDAGAFELLLTIAANEERDSWFEGWNTLVLEIFYLLFRGVKPTALSGDQAKAPKENLNRLLLLEESKRLDTARKAASRHSRFGTTITVTLNAAKNKNNARPEGETVADTPNGAPLVLHRQAGLSAPAGKIMDIKKKTKLRNLGGAEDDGTAGSIGIGGRDDNLGLQGRAVLRNVARSFMSCFNIFLASLLKDIKAERPKITEQDNMRLLFITKWFLTFFLESRERYYADPEKSSDVGEEEMWQFGTIAEVVEKGWIGWVLRRMRTAVEEKPKLWTELQAGNECLTQLLLVLAAMSTASPIDDKASAEAEAFADAAAALSSQIIYNGEILDIAVEALRSYRPGTQSLGYLESAVNLAWAVFRMLERWGKEQAGGADSEMYVRKKKARRKKRSQNEEDGIVDVEDDEPNHEHMINETMFKFEEYEMKFANYEITNTLLAYLSRFRDFASPEPMKRVVSLLHRQAVRAKAEGLFFNPSTLILFNSILNQQQSLPKEKPYKELISLITYITRQFFKAITEEPFVAVEAFYPKNRNNWKQFSSWEPEEKVKKPRKQVDDTRFPAELSVKKGYSWSEQVGIVVASLVEAGQQDLIDWVKDILQLVIHQRKRLIDEIDAHDAEEDDTILDDEALKAKNSKEPSAEAREKLTDYLIPYVNDEQGDAATKNSEFKLLLRLLEFFILDEDADEMEWCIPSSLLPSQLQGSLNVIAKFLETPINLDGKQASSLLAKKNRRKRRAPVSSDEDDGGLPDLPDSDGEEPREKKKKKIRQEKKKREEVQYKSAQFIEDSDAEYGDMETFLLKEIELRARTAAAAASGKPITMKATGTKKRVRGKKDPTKSTKKHKGEPEVEEVLSSDQEDSSPVKPRPKPKPTGKKKSVSPVASSRESTPISSIAIPIARVLDKSADSSGSEDGPTSLPVKRKTRVVISDDDG